MNSWIPVLIWLFAVLAIVGMVMLLTHDALKVRRNKNKP